MSYLIDTSVATRLGAKAVRERISSLDGKGLARTPMIDLEVGFSARSGEEWDRLHGALEAFGEKMIEPLHMVRAQQVQRLLADRGLRGRKVPDLLIAAVAESASLVVLHYDADFDHISSVTGQATEWIVPRGTIN